MCDKTLNFQPAVDPRYARGGASVRLPRACAGPPRMHCGATAGMYGSTAGMCGSMCDYVFKKPVIAVQCYF
ncbi:hypothetical protein Y032_0103g3582 [Ancylostoma ceylanicum]|uniref:Uncharacterized protein n=1 Tax=Ancylostoma ceylanicum TaxID=53326 RepID=A0A016TGA8_9BILA|nr:hypothetical protein Y032_0103g3582 [Ancylostoma ceylanicum]